MAKKRIPADFAALLAAHACRKTFDAFPPSHQQEYLDWINEAKKPETRQRRMDKALAMIKQKRET